MAKYALESAKGSAGTILFVHPQCVHGSIANISPFEGNVIVIVYNSFENTLENVEKPQPEFAASRDYRPIVPLSEESLFKTIHLLSLKC